MSRESLSASALVYGDEERGRSVDVGVTLTGFMVGVDVDLGSRVEDEYGDTFTVRLGPCWVTYWRGSWRAPLGGLGLALGILALIAAAVLVAGALQVAAGTEPVGLP